MALNAAVIWEVRSTGNDLNGGGFKVGAAGTDYSQQNNAQKSGADLTMHATTNTKVSPVAAKVAAADVGNLIYIASGTNWTAGFYEITAQDGGDPGYWTLDRSPNAAGDANLGTYKMGGGLASPGLVSAAAVGSNIAFIKYGSYSITSATPSIAGGCIAGWSYGLVCGYDTTRTVSNQDANRPTLTLAAEVSSATMVAVSSRRLILDGAGNTSSRGCSALVEGCSGSNFTNSAFNSWAFNCHATGCSAVVAFASLAVGCTATGNSIASFGSYSFHCLAWANTATPFYSSSAPACIYCSAYGNTGATTDGFYTLSSSGSIFLGCISEANGRYGFHGGATSYKQHYAINCAHYNNTSVGVYGVAVEIGTITLTGSPFVDAVNANFALNNTAGAGAACRAAGYPATFPLGLTASYRDIGAAQHADPAGGGGGFPILGGSVVR